MGKINSRSKGAAGEREGAELIARLFQTEASRSCRNGVERAEDVFHGIPELFCEIKRVEALNVNKALKKASVDAGDRVPTLWHRRNRDHWLMTIYAEDLHRLVAVFMAQEKKNAIASGACNTDSGMLGADRDRGGEK